MDSNFSLLQENLVKAKSILILTGANPSLDSVAASLSLFLVLKKRIKNIKVACPTPMTVAFNRLVAVDKISNKIGNRNLIVSFDYIKDSIEKVSYNIENNRFNLVIEPKKDKLAIDINKVNYSYSGVQADMIFIIGVAKLENLGNFYIQERKVFSEAMTVNIDNKKGNSYFAKINFCDSKIISCSELIISLIQNLNLEIDADVVTNLYMGIKANTANFQAINVNANTFEASAWCLKNGARKEQMTNSFFNKPIPQSLKTNLPLIQKNQVNRPPMPFSQTTKPLNNPHLIEAKEVKAPPDWFKPKIYRGNTKI